MPFSVKGYLANSSPFESEWEEHKAWRERVYAVYGPDGIPIEVEAAEIGYLQSQADRLLGQGVYSEANWATYSLSTQKRLLERLVHDMSLVQGTSINESIVYTGYK
jgi:hypothetical protein